jgi:hypothetical protein
MVNAPILFSAPLFYGQRPYFMVSVPIYGQRPYFIVSAPIYGQRPYIK